MENKQQTDRLEPTLLCLIVNQKQAKRITAIARANNSPIGTFAYCQGSVQEKILRFLGLDNVRREIALFINDFDSIQSLFNAFAEEFDFSNKQTGIEFMVPLSKVVGTMMSTETVIRGVEKEEDTMYEAIITIVDRGLSKTVMDVAIDAGAKGGTIVHGRGTGRDQVKTVFNMEIEPEKEIILIISKKEEVDNICNAINNELGFDQPNTGILFTFPLLDTKGID